MEDHAVNRRLRRYVEIANNEKRRLIEAVQREAIYASKGNAKRSLTGSKLFRSWMVESPEVTWVAVYGVNAICVVSEILPPDVTLVGKIQGLPDQERTLFTYLRSIAYKIEDGSLLDKVDGLGGQSIKKPFSVVSVFPEIRWYDEKAAFEFLSDKMQENKPALTLDETVQTAIAAQQILSFCTFQYYSIKVCVIDYDMDFYARELGHRSIIKHLHTAIDSNSKKRLMEYVQWQAVYASKGIAKAFLTGPVLFREWMVESPEVTWVAVHGVSKICVVSEILPPSVTLVGKIQGLTDQKRTLLNYLRSIAHKIEDGSLFKEVDGLKGQSIEKPFSVVSVFPGIRLYDEKGALEFLSQKMQFLSEKMQFLSKKMLEKKSALIWKETIRTAIAAHQILSSVRFQCHDIKVCLIDYNTGLKLRACELEDGSIIEQLAAINR